MKLKNEILVLNFDLKYDSLTHREKTDFDASQKIAEIALAASQVTYDMAEVARVPRLRNGERENNTEHSFMLALAAPEIACALGLDHLNRGLVQRFALVHDMIEIKTGDTATFSLTEEEFCKKERQEKAALKELIVDIKPLLPIVASDLEKYERQDCEEAVFVRMVDKLMPVAVDITGQGLRVMHEDYGVTSYDDLVRAHDLLHARISQKFSGQFPQLVAAHAELCSQFEALYLEKSIV